MAEVHGAEVDELVAGATAYVSCRFPGAALEGADLTRLTFEGCAFEAANLRNARFHDTRLTDCTFVGCDLLGVDLTVLDWPQFGLADPPAFVDCRMDHVDAHGLALDGIVLYGCARVEADLEGSALRGADLRHADLTGTRLSGTDLSEADLTGAVGYDLHPERTTTTGARVSLPEGAAILRALGLVVTSSEDRMSAVERLADR